MKPKLLCLLLGYWSHCLLALVGCLRGLLFCLITGHSLLRRLSFISSLKSILRFRARSCCLCRRDSLCCILRLGPGRSFRLAPSFQCLQRELEAESHQYLECPWWPQGSWLLPLLLSRIHSWHHFEHQAWSPHLLWMHLREDDWKLQELEHCWCSWSEVDSRPQAANSRTLLKLHSAPSQHTEYPWPLRKELRL